MAEYHSISDLVKLSINNKQELWQVVLTGQAHDKLMSERDVFAQMKKMYQAMKSADEQYDQQLRSPSKMAGGDGYKMSMDTNYDFELTMGDRNKIIPNKGRIKGKNKEK